MGVVVGHQCVGLGLEHHPGGHHAGGRLRHLGALGLRGGLIRRGHLPGQALDLGVQRGVPGGHLGGAVGQLPRILREGGGLVLELAQPGGELPGAAVEGIGAVEQFVLPGRQLGGTAPERARALVQRHRAVVE